ncbi:MAG: hypothetical protein AB7T49_10420 [Oligoflexales bacterium]
MAILQKSTYFLALSVFAIASCKVVNTNSSKTEGIPGILEDNFVAPDRDANSTPYTCSYHWFALEDGRIVGLDLIRSDDTGKMALRAYYQDAHSEFKGISYEAPKEKWRPFATERASLADSNQNALGRSKNWIGGHVRTDDGATIFFDLEVRPKSFGLGTGSLGLFVTDLVATDYLEVEYGGTITIGGETHEIQTLGTASVHYGNRLPLAGYIATVPSNSGLSDDHFLLASANSDNIRVGGELLEGKNITYGYSRGALGRVFLSFKPFNQQVPIGNNGFVTLTDVKRFDHNLLGVKTTTGMAKAKFQKKAQWPWEQDIERDLGTVIFDYRGDPYLKTLP